MGQTLRGIGSLYSGLLVVDLHRDDAVRERAPRRCADGGRRVDQAPGRQTELEARPVPRTGDDTVLASPSGNDPPTCVHRSSTARSVPLSLKTAIRRSPTYTRFARPGPRALSLPTVTRRGIAPRQLPWRAPSSGTPPRASQDWRARARTPSSHWSRRRWRCGHGTRHVGHAVVHHTLLNIWWIMVRRRTSRFGTTALVDRDVHER